MSHCTAHARGVNDFCGGGILKAIPAIAPERMRKAREKEWKVYDAERLAKFFGVTADTIQEWCRKGKLPAFKIGREWKVRARDLQKAIEGKVAARKRPPGQSLF
ncbi:MAG: helix-turn-helix domain-containing protein [Candidatus Liptonbacteria bacterium]|nr:helix-turn-helix domain-containing protein [Candidatus Liptonbacteria bacterium]